MHSKSGIPRFANDGMSEKRKVREVFSDQWQLLVQYREQCEQRLERELQQWQCEQRQQEQQQLRSLCPLGNRFLE